jgi:hypothetical protein
VSSDDVMKMLTVYLAMGNNPFQDKRQQKARDPAKASETVTWLSGKKVKQNASEGNPITLGRVAKAYAPVLLAYRDSLAGKDKLRVQIDTRSPVEQADIAFLGYERMEQCRDSVDFVEKFGLIITKANPRNAKLSDDEVIKRNRAYADIARRGLETDLVMKSLLDLKKLPDVATMMGALHKRLVPTKPSSPPSLTPGVATGAAATRT